MAGPRLRRGTRADAVHLAMFVDMASKGMSVRVWEGLAAPTQSPLEVGRARAQRENVPFSYRNATIAEQGGEVAGGLVGYTIVPDDTDILTVPSPFRPILELEREVPGHWYVNVLGVYPEFRGRGIGSALLVEADRIGAAAAPEGMAIIVDDGNLRARRLYERHGYRLVTARPQMPVPGVASGATFLLLTRPHG
ncbi:MAG: GNAT family N-acetyltransferase [Bauldia sp.]